MVAKGPIQVCVDASDDSFSFYSSGIYSGPCTTSCDHAVTLVGYSSTYWIIQNSWDKTWGDNGFMKIQMGTTCGILSGVQAMVI